MRIIPLYPNLLWSFIGCLVGLSNPVAAQAQAATREDAPLEHLMEAIDLLKKKTIPQAYFWLSSPQVPPSTIFTPDTKGSGFVLIARYQQLEKDVDWTSLKNRQTDGGNLSRAAILDEIHQRLVYYTDAEWQQLATTMQSWVIQKHEISAIASANQWKLENEIIVLRIPSGDLRDFFAALLRAWGTTKQKFRCSAQWN